MIKVSRTEYGREWDIQVPGLPVESAPAIPEALKTALVQLAERIRAMDAKRARVLVTVEVQPEQMNDVITGAIN
ncbi:hypothetical protein [Microlunatus endophyticus]|uniref:hypothetical protein n=1 Tax=Microlunatus endophyticus TaxID=1716077 RepID=UPI0016674DF8|nr:hypothetical protein [Microlunatus endophyticus]